jgi:hypothetical protein
MRSLHISTQMYRYEVALKIGIVTETDVRILPSSNYSMNIELTERGQKDPDIMKFAQVVHYLEKIGDD